MVENSSAALCLCFHVLMEIWNYSHLKWFSRAFNLRIIRSFLGIYINKYTKTSNEMSINTKFSPDRKLSNTPAHFEMISAENTVGQRKICHKKKYHNESVALFSLFFRQQPCGLVSCCSRWLVCFLLFQMWSDLFEECGALQQLLLKQIFNMADHIFTVPTARLSPATSHFSNSTTWVFVWRSERLNKMQQESESNIPLTRA